jgi:hypothetical protein
MNFYNPKISMLSIKTSISRCCLQLSISNTINPDIKGLPEKGQKVYDWEHAQFFSISPTECCEMFSAIPKILMKEYENPKEKLASLTKSFTLTHFRENQPHKLALSLVESERFGKSLNISMLPPNGKLSYYVFRNLELSIFIEFVRKGYTDLPYHAELYDGVFRARKEMEYKMKDKKQTNSKPIENIQASNTSDIFDDFDTSSTFNEVENSENSPDSQIITNWDNLQF